MLCINDVSLPVFCLFCTYITIQMVLIPRVEHQHNKTTNRLATTITPQICSCSETKYLQYLLLLLLLLLYYIIYNYIFEFIILNY